MKMKIGLQIPMKAQPLQTMTVNSPLNMLMASWLASVEQT